MTRYFFIHLPKTAGTSFKGMLLKKIPSAQIYANPEDQQKHGWRYPDFEDYLLLSEKKINTIKLLVGHIPFFFKDIFSEKDEVICLSFLRSPKERVISTLNYIKYYLAEKHDEYKKYKELDLSQIYENLGPNMANIQVRFFADNSFTPPYYFYQKKELNQKALENAKLNLNKCSFIGVTEYFGKSIKLFNSLNLGIQLDDIIKENQTPKKEHKIDTVLLNRITSDNHFDIEFYKYAMEEFDRKCKKLNL